MTRKSTFYDLAPHQPDFRRDLLLGLMQEQRAIPSLHLYDERGSALFARICQTPEYYLTRTEEQLLGQHYREIATLLPPNLTVLELGSGLSEKALTLLAGLGSPQHYVAIEIAMSGLHNMAEAVERRCPHLHFHGICADFTDTWRMPNAIPTDASLLFLPGSTLGNFDPEQAVALLRHCQAQLQGNAYMLLGLDTCTDPTRLDAAYDDPAGHSAAFALNLVRRMQSELAVSIREEDFAYRAHYNPAERRVEMGLDTTKTVRFALGDAMVEMPATSHIRTEYSYKFDPERMQWLAAHAGLDLCAQWNDTAGLFGLYLFRPTR